MYVLKLDKFLNLNSAGSKFSWNINYYKLSRQCEKYKIRYVQTLIWISHNNMNAQNLLPALFEINDMQRFEF